MNEVTGYTVTLCVLMLCIALIAIGGCHECQATRRAAFAAGLVEQSSQVNTVSANTGWLPATSNK